MLIILAGWVLSFIYFFITGIFISKLIYFALNKKFIFLNPLLFVLLGIFLTFFWLSGYSLFFAINDFSWVIAIILFLISVFFCRSEVYYYLINGKSFLHKKINLYFILIILLGLFSFSYFAAHPITWPDTYLYHFNVVRWANEYAVVPGLANLHIRFGFNSIFFLYAAFMNTGLFSSLGVYLAVSFLVVFYFIYSLLNLFSPTQPIQLKIFSALTLPWVYAHGWTNEMASYSTDLPVAILFLIFISLILQKTEIKRILLFCTALMLFSIKFNGVIPLFLLILITGVVFINKRKITELRELLLMTSLLILFMSFYLARNYYLSGWLLFPYQGLGMDVPWLVSVEQLKSITEDITGWARMPGPSYRTSLENGFYFWFFSWYKGFIQTFEYFLLLAGMFGLIIMPFIKNILFGIDLKLYFFALSIVGLSILVWFINAPDLRFGSIFVWSLFALAMIPFFSYISEQNKLTTLAILITSYMLFFQINAGIKIEMGLNLINLASPERKELDQLEIANSSYALYITKPPSDQCGDSLLPCTPYPNERLRLLDPNNLAKGFYLK